MIEQRQQENSNLALNKYLASQDLKLKLKNLENRFTELTDVKLEYERKINNFNSNYMLRFGGLIEEILKLRVHIFGKRKQYSQRKNALENLNEFIKKIIRQLEDLPQPLDDSEYQQLKIAYRKASRLCHPDKLIEDAKVKGEEIFKALNEAYRHQDLNLVQGILLKLESEATSLIKAVKQIDNRALLQEKINLLYEQIATVEAEIKCLQENEIYQRIQSITDMEWYFAGLERELQAELEALKGAYSGSI